MSIEICKELHKDFIDFSYEANSQRAFPSALDGLKPGQRACLWEFYNKGYLPSKPHVKSAKVAGGVIASWWPHGDTAIYETFARMSQPWINNIPEVDWHGANGSQIGGPECASSRYTEARLSKAAQDGFFSNIKNNCVNMILNFTEDDEWPEVLPAIFPRLFVNGSQGIGMTIANHFAPGNLTEFIPKVEEYLETKEVNCEDIYPDYPSGGVIVNKKELKTIYETGKGRIVLRAKTEIKNNSILIYELPYQVYVEPFIDSVKDLVIKEEITGIKEIYNKSDKKQILIEIECDNSPKKILDDLFRLTELQKIFNPNQYALVSKVPELMNLKRYIEVYVNHNINCITKEYNFLKKKAEAQLHILDGLLKALEDIDNIITLIKKSESAATAREELKVRYNFSNAQVKAILDMKLSRLAHLESIEIENDKKNLINNINNYSLILQEPEKEFIKRLKDFESKYGYPRHTEIIDLDFSNKKKEEEYIEPEKCVVIMTESGNIKRIPASSFKTQHRNTKGVKTQDDITSTILRTDTVDSLMVFTNKGMLYKIRVNDIPEGTNVSKGVSLKTLTNMEIDEKPQVIYSLYKDTEAKYIIFITEKGIIKRTPLEEYNKTKKLKGITALNFQEGDTLASAFLATDEDVIIATEKGNIIRFNSEEASSVGRIAIGVKGIGLNENDKVIAAIPVRNPGDSLAIFTANGMGRKLKLSEVPSQRRAGKGSSYVSKGENIVAITLVEDEDSLLICGSKNSICIKAKEIPYGPKRGLGNIIIKGDTIVSVSKV